MTVSMRRMRARVSLVQGKVKFGLSVVLILISILLVDHYLGIVSIVLEKDFETDFSYPLDVENFPALIESFRNGEAVDYEPVNRLYTKARFLEKADSKCEDVLMMVILVKSAPGNFLQRSAIRATWGNGDYLRNMSNFVRARQTTTSNSNKRRNLPRYKTNSEPNILFKLVFLIGLIPNHDYHHLLVDDQKHRPEQAESFARMTKDGSINGNMPYRDVNSLLEESLQNESRTYKDIVRIETLDSYLNNTFKTMMGIRYLEEICTDYEYALLVDDDMYISVKNLLLFIENPTAYPDGSDIDNAGSDTMGQVVDVNRLFAGKVLFTRPIRQRIGSSAKWYLSLDEYPYNYFPRYMPAAAIVMSKRVVDDFYYASFYTKHFRFDDIYLGIIAFKMNIVPFSSSYFRVCHYPDGKCRGLITTKRRSKDSWEGSEEYELSVVDQMENVIARHGLTPEQLVDLWRELMLFSKT